VPNAVGLDAERREKFQNLHGSLGANVSVKITFDGRGVELAAKPVF